MPELRTPCRAHVSALPQLPRPHQGPVRVVRQAGGSTLEPLPVLRDADPPGGARARIRAQKRTPDGVAPDPRHAAGVPIGIVRGGRNRFSGNPRAQEALLEPLRAPQGGIQELQPAAGAARKAQRQLALL